MPIISLFLNGGILKSTANSSTWGLGLDLTAGKELWISPAAKFRDRALKICASRAAPADANSGI